MMSLFVNMDYHVWQWCSLCALIVLICVQPSNAGILENSKRRPNVIFMLMDDMGLSDNSIELFSDPERPSPFQTPHMKRLADEGMTFSRSYTSASVCGPSRASLLTGLSPWKHYVRGNYGQATDFKIPNRNQLIFESAKNEGYNVGYVGKWGFCDEPMLRGVDIFFGIKGHKEAHSFYPEKTYYHRREGSVFAIPPNGIDESDPALKDALKAVSQNIVESPFDFRLRTNYILPLNSRAEPDRCTTIKSDGTFKCRHIEVETIDQSMQVFDELVNRSKTHDEPFFLFVSSFIPHLGSFSKDPNDAQVKAIDIYDDTCPNTLKNLVVEGYELTKRQRTNECRHKSMIENYIDATVGKLLAKMEEHDIEENTLIIVTSDHGSEKVLLPNPRDYKTEYVHNPETFPSTGGLRGFKRTLYEGAVRLPTIMKWKGVIEAGSVSDHIFALYDIFPTLVEAMMKDPPPSNLSGEDEREYVKSYIGARYQTEGLSILPTMLGVDSLQPKHTQLEFSYCEPTSILYSELIANLVEGVDIHDENMLPILRKQDEIYCSWAALMNNYKLIFTHTTGEYALYDLTTNPKESDDLKMDISSGTGEEIFLRMIANYEDPDTGYIPFLWIYEYEPEQVCEHTFQTHEDGPPPYTPNPTSSPTRPTSSPTTHPTTSPTESPTVEPTISPTNNPTTSPIPSPTSSPTASPTEKPTTSPTEEPTTSPTTIHPTISPTVSPSVSPTRSPTTSEPSVSPTGHPTTSPSTGIPSTSPTNSPTDIPTESPTRVPSTSPTFIPTLSPETNAPTISPIADGDKVPIIVITRSPTMSVGETSMAVVPRREIVVMLLCFVQILIQFN